MDAGLTACCGWQAHLPVPGLLSMIPKKSVATAVRRRSPEETRGPGNYPGPGRWRALGRGRSRLAGAPCNAGQMQGRASLLYMSRSILVRKPPRALSRSRHAFGTEAILKSAGRTPTFTFAAARLFDPGFPIKAQAPISAALSPPPRSDPRMTLRTVDRIAALETGSHGPPVASIPRNPDFMVSRKRKAPYGVHGIHRRSPQSARTTR